ncbi:MAG: class I SAM-dependent methyltransferase [Planctomycetota bacterium]
MDEAAAEAFYRKVPKESVACNICGSRKVRKVGIGDRYGMGLRTVLCAGCGLIYVNPRPTRAAMDDFYERHYRSFYESVEFPTKTYIAEGVFGTRASGMVGMIYDRGNLSDAPRVLDVGCSEGSGLRAVRERWPHSQRQGIEPSPSFGAFAREYASADIFTGSLDEFMSHRLPSEPLYDLVIASHVLEHMVDPRRELGVIRDLLNNEGLLYLEVPNVVHPAGAGGGQYHLAHLFLFVPQTLENLLAVCGYEWIAARHDGCADPWAMAYLCRKAPPRAPKFLKRNTVDAIGKAACMPPSGIRRGLIRRLRRIWSFGI